MKGIATPRKGHVRAIHGECRREASREVDCKVAKVACEDAHLALHLARRDCDEKAALLDGFVVDEVVVEQLRHVAQEVGRQLLVGRARGAPARDGDVVEAGRAGQVREAVAYDPQPPKVIKLLYLHDNLGPALDARRAVVQVDRVVPRGGLGLVPDVRGLRVAIRVTLQHGPVLAVLDPPPARHTVAKVHPADHFPHDVDLRHLGRRASLRRAPERRRRVRFPPHSPLVQP
mmetsp:Transcript_16906/g.35305  ORF Transcript_16906/g.35305 Transcript_16906/m.35305 type:complete len:231 (+) Transcript_16906:564-1256(+)